MNSRQRLKLRITIECIVLSLLFITDSLIWALLSRWHKLSLGAAICGGEITVALWYFMLAVPWAINTRRRLDGKRERSTGRR